jgi:ribosomal protein L7/L12
MKLDKIKFARLISIITNIAGHALNNDEVDVVNHVIDIDVPEPEQIYPNASLVTDLMHAFANDQKINAIRAHRAMTGMGLKESKDEVEKYWPERKQNV